MASSINESSGFLGWGLIENHFTEEGKGYRASERGCKEPPNCKQSLKTSLDKSCSHGPADCWYSAEQSPIVSIGIRKETGAMESARVQKTIASPQNNDTMPSSFSSPDYNRESISLEGFEQILPRQAGGVIQQSIISSLSQEISLNQPVKESASKNIVSAHRSLSSQLQVAHQQAKIQTVDSFEVQKLQDSVMLLTQSFVRDREFFAKQLNNEKELRMRVERKFTQQIGKQEKALDCLSRRISDQENQISEQQQTIIEQKGQIETLSDELTHQCALTRVLTKRVAEREQKNAEALNELRALQITVDQLENTLDERTEEILEERRERGRLTLENDAIRLHIAQQDAVNQELLQTTQELNRELAIVRQQLTIEKEQREQEEQIYKIQLEERRALLEERVNQLSEQKDSIEAQLAQKIDLQAQLDADIVDEYASKAARECAKVGALAATIFSAGLLPALGITTTVEKVDQSLRNALSASTNNQWHINNFRIQKNTIENSINRLNGRINALTAKIARLESQENSMEGRS